ncbi:MAG: hypothetical protein EBQ96_00445 [Proteobacteria bacterium]|nr:hypothetical protein [Pseudomonadota bacterium]
MLFDMPDWDEDDERDNKNRFATYEQIDERQAVDLLVLLDKWENAELEPHEALVSLNHIMGCRAAFLIGYNVGKKFAPGGEQFKKFAAEVPGDVAKGPSRSIRSAKQEARQTIEHIDRIKAGRKDKATTDTEVPIRYLTELQAFRTKHPSLAKPLKVNDDLMGHPTFVEAVRSLLPIRDEAIAAGDKLIEAICEHAIVKMRSELKEAQDRAADPEKALADYTAEATVKWADTVEEVKKMLRPEVFDPQKRKAIKTHIAYIRTKLEKGKAGSWEAAEKIAEILLPPADEKDWDQRDAPILQIREDLKQSHEAAQKHKSDPQQTLDLFKPITEADIKGPLAIKFAKNRAYAAWYKAEVEKWKAEHGGKEPGPYDISEWGFSRAGYPGYPKEGEAVAFIPPIDYLDRKLVHGLEIAPSGTALIEVYEHDDASWEVDIYGSSVARITTYAITFEAKSDEDAKALQAVLKRALEVLGDQRHKYTAPDYTPSGDGYVRPQGTAQDDSNYFDRIRNYIKLDGCKVSPALRLDLDDLWLLYYLMEPVIEPNAQIAAAMNAARYAEERGAILAPHAVDFIDKGHNVADPLNSFKKDEDDLLAAAARDALISRALNTIDDAQWTLRMATLAAHTLNGGIVDNHGAFPAFDRLIAEGKTGKSGALVTFDEALKDRTHALMQCVLGLPEGSTIPIPAALAAVLSKISSPLQERFRAEAKSDHIATDLAISRKMNSFAASGGDMFSQITAGFDAQEMAERISGLFAGRAAQTNSEASEARDAAYPRDAEHNRIGGPVATSGNSLVVASSAVETAIDGIHADGRYQTRTKGSPLVRHEMPETLKPFCPQPRNQPSQRLLTSLVIG